MATSIFGAGVCVGTRTDIIGATPLNFGILQDVSFDMNADLKMLYGQRAFPEAVARGKIKLMGKAKMGVFSAQLFNAIFFGQTIAAGNTATSYAEAGVIPATPFTITVANSATFTADQGVSFVTTGLSLVKVASAPTTGQYSVAAGVYTFAAADTLKAVLFTYNYTIAASGQTLTVNNQFMGAAPYFSLMFYGKDPGGNACTMTFQKCVANKLTMATKQDDWMIPEMDFEAFSAPTSQVLLISQTEAS